MELFSIYRQLGLSENVWHLGEKISAELQERFQEIDTTAEYNQAKVLAAMQDCRIGANHLPLPPATDTMTTAGSGWSRCMPRYSTVKRPWYGPQITCGTHALTVALSANLLPGDELLSPVGLPYDTLQEVIGIRPSPCSLAEYGVIYRQADLKEDGPSTMMPFAPLSPPRTKLITIQRSKGYATRPSFTVEQIGELIAFCKSVKPDVICMVDNCYGEFVETIEPTDVGADMVVGSLIKNPGGGLAPIGGYICGTKECVERCAYRLSAPGLGQEVGANLGHPACFLPGLLPGAHRHGRSFEGRHFCRPSL